MRQNIQTILKKLGLNEPFYWGKRVVRSLPQPGAFKSHAVVAHWVSPDLIRFDLRAGLSGKTLATKELGQYPLQFQTATFFEFRTDEKDDQDDQKGKSGKASGGGGGLRKKLNDPLHGVFSQSRDTAVATHAVLTRGVVMGMEIGAKALPGVFDLFVKQIQSAKVLVTDLLASAGRAVTRYTPPAFMSPRGDETKVYKYDRAKNETMFGVAPT
jgi:hypothetical protein